MSKNLVNHFLFNRVLATVIVLFLSVPKTEGSSFSACENADILSVRESRELEPSENLIQWIEVSATESGLLHVEVQAAADAAIKPLLGFWGFDCATRSQPLIVDRSPEHLTLQVEAFSTLIFRIADQRGRALAGALAIRTAFLPAGPVEKGGEDEEVIELDGLRAPPTSLCPYSDDHGDSLACASRLGRSLKLAGEIDTASDVDAFRIHIGASGASEAIDDTELWRVRAFGAEGLRLTLHDDQGLQLTGDDSSLEEGAVLASGSYFLRISALDGETRSYRLAVQSESW